MGADINASARTNRIENLRRKHGKQVKGANIAGFVKVANAMLAYGAG